MQTAVIASFLVAGIGSAATVITPSGDPGRSAGNPFDYANINSFSNSATYNYASDIRDIFGGSFSTLEAPGRTIFSDSYGTTTYQITFTTNTPSSISGYSLYLAEDGLSLNRSATNFQLKADGNLISNVAILTAGQSYASVYGSGAIKISDTFARVTATTFQAIFTSNVGNFTGVRVMELDAQSASAPNFTGGVNGVPEPTSIRLALLGGLILASLFRKRIHI